jgi:glycosyltransferase involved in cell wall biosynthesis
MPAPVTVIIPTYNWSSALRSSIASVLEQTFRDFELLVIGDCCTDDSADVVLSFADARAQWHNLSFRHKSQSGPNNFGIGIASGNLIAYLGHDDVWHPDHLRSLVSKIEETGADLACSVCIMYGPPASGFRMASGVFIEGRYRRHDFLPPSSLMHRRELIARIGPWARPEDLPSPVDSDFLRRAFQAGARFTSTDRLTAFKFNSAWRRDSYLLRDTSEQQCMLNRLRSDSAGCVEQEWAALMRAQREYRLLVPTILDQWDCPPGHYHHVYLRARGLEGVDLSDLLEARRFSVDDQESLLDWHGVERSEEWGSYRWTGPSPAAFLTLPVRAPARFRIHLQLLNWLGVDLASEVSLAVAGQKIEFTCAGTTAPIVELDAVVSTPEDSSGGPLRVQIACAHLRCPFFETEGRSPDTRWLGVCVNWIEVEPVSPA